MGNTKYAATRLTMSIGVAVLVVMTAVVPVPIPSASASEPPPPDKTALILGGTTIPTPDNAMVEAVRNHLIGPTQPGQEIEYVAVTTPEELWPLTGVLSPRFARAGATERLRAWWPRVAR